MEKYKWINNFTGLIFLVALLLRLGPVIATRELEIGLDDMFQYDMLARSLASGEGFRWYGEEDLKLIQRYIPLEFISDDYDPRGVLTSFRPPAYSFFLSLIYRLFGLENRFFITRLVQAFVGALLSPLTYLLARHLFPDKEKAARWAAVAITVYPMLVIFPLALATEVIFLPLVLGVLVVLLKAGQSHRWQDYLLAGVLLGIGVLTRSVILAILPFILLWAWFMAKDRLGTLLLLLGVLVFLVPWSVRNTRLHGEFTMVENAMGYTLYQGYYPGNDGKFTFGPSLDLMPYLDDAERNRIGTEKALEFIREDPSEIPYLTLRKMGYFFGLERKVLTYFYANNIFGYIPQPFLTGLFLLFTLPFVVVACLAAVALPAMKWNKERALAGVVVAAYAAPHFLLLAEPRFHLAVVPMLAVFAGYAWVERYTLWTRLMGAGSRWKLALAVVLLALLLFNWGFELWQDREILVELFGPKGNKLYLPY